MNVIIPNPSKKTSQNKIELINKQQHKKGNKINKIQSQTTQDTKVGI